MKPYKIEVIGIAYCCSECNQEYDDEIDAEDCCKDIDEANYNNNLLRKGEIK